MNCWLILFTGTTWREFRQAGATITGFRERMAKAVARIRPGDLLLCYLTGVMRWVGAVEVIAPSDDRTPIWKDGEFPVRLQVKPVVLMDPEHGIPMDHLKGKADFYRGPEERGQRFVGLFT